MLRPRLLHGLSPGERAFDRCLLPFAIAFVVNLTWAILHLIQHHNKNRLLTEQELAGAVPDPAWYLWIPFAIGVLLAIYWVWALRGVVDSWSDPVARILRFCSLVLLTELSLSVLSLLSSPLAHLLTSSASH